MSGSNSSGVRNLRAMFENQNASSSPEPRGRSPAGSSTSDNSRPTSKVRASFVSVVPHSAVAASPLSPALTAPKEFGTAKGTGSNTGLAQRRESFSISGEAEDVQELKKVISEEKEERKKSVAVAEAIPEQAVESREASRAPPPVREPAGKMTNLGTIMKGSDFPDSEPESTPAPTPAAEIATPKQPVAEEPTVKPGEAIPPVETEEKPAESSAVETPADNPDKVVTGVQEEASLKPADPTQESAVAGGEALPPPAETLPHLSGSKPAPSAPAADEAKLKATDTPRTNGRATTKKPATISTSRSPARGTSSARSPLPKSPLPKTPTAPKPTSAAAASKSPAPVKALPKVASSKEPAKAAATKTTRAPARPSTATSGTTASAAAKAKAPVADTKKTATKPTPASKDPTTTSPTGFKKPKPRSPTRPVRLPSHLTAPTASSAAKHGEEAAAATAAAAPKAVRKPATVSKPAPKPAASVAKKQPARASLAPSASTTKRPESRTSTAGAGDGFLARMMRPTASSASKTHDKPASPPRRAAGAKPTSKPKAPEGLVAKSKKKVEEVAAKTKDVFTNGHDEEHHEAEHHEAEHHESSRTVAPEPATEGGAEADSAPTEPKDTLAAVDRSADDAGATAQSEPAAVVESEAPKAQEEEAVF